MRGWWMGGSRGSESRSLPQDVPLDSVRYVVLDTELTSLDHRTNRLLSIGALAMQGPSIQLGHQFYRVVNPEVSIPAQGVVIHKLRSEDVQRGGALEEALTDFCRFVTGAVLVGHFVGIDLKILRKEMSQWGQKLDNPSIDTVRVQQWMLRHGTYSEDLHVKLEKLDLRALAKFYGVELQDAHHALSDAFLTARVWQKMLHALSQRGVSTLRKLIRIGGA
jgi:DNA polymerase-3 subunit epsilon